MYLSEGRITGWNPNHTGQLNATLREKLTTHATETLLIALSTFIKINSKSKSIHIIG